MTDITSGEGRGIRVLIAAAFAAGIALLTLVPATIAGPVRGLFLRAVWEATQPIHGGWLPGDLDSVLNTLLFVPLGAAVALLLSRRAWPLAVVAGFVLSAGVEFAQASIPGRVPDAGDVLWNTVGAAVGVVAVTLPRAAAAGVRRRRQRGRLTRT